MPEEIQRRMKELEKALGTETIEQSWFYCFLKARYNHLTNQDKKQKTNSIMKLEEKTEEELEDLKYRILSESLTIIKPEMTVEWLSLVNKNINNTYYISIIEAAIHFVKEVNNVKSIEEAEKKVLKDSFDLSGFQLKTLQDIISTYFNDDIYISDLRNKSTAVSLVGFSK